MLTPILDKLTKLPRRPLVIGAGAAAALVTIAALTIAQAANEPATSRLAGLEVSQDKSAYTITIPEAQASGARLHGRTLQVRTRDEATGLESEQRLSLPDADLTREPQVTRKNGSLVVTVPKYETSSTAADPSPDSAFAAAGADPLAPSLLGGFDSDIFARMEQMQKQMDAMFSRAFADADSFGAAPMKPTMPGLAARSRLTANAGLDVEEKDGNYIVRARNLDPVKQNINVAVDNERILKITAKHEDNAANRRAMSQFTKVFTLPGPVKGSEMKIDQQDGALVITLPKA